MKRICCGCGNTDFEGIDTSRPFICPVPGCGRRYDPQRLDWIILRSAGDMPQLPDSTDWLKDTGGGVADD